MAKKWLVGTLMAIMLFSLMGCGDSKAVNNKSETKKVLKVGTNPNLHPLISWTAMEKWLDLILILSMQLVKRSVAKFKWKTLPLMD